MTGVVVRRRRGRSSCEERVWHGWLCGDGVTGVVVRRGRGRGGEEKV